MANNFQKLKDAGLIDDKVKDDEKHTEAINALSDGEVAQLISAKELVEKKGFRTKPLGSGQNVVVL